jgi:hypothetical protein
LVTLIYWIFHLFTLIYWIFHLLTLIYWIFHLSKKGVERPVYYYSVFSGPFSNQTLFKYSTTNL